MSNSSRCNGENDCVDGSDEYGCGKIGGGGGGRFILFFDKVQFI